jgi:hypothetical protein
VDSSPITKQQTETTVNRRSLKWHSSYLNIAADPATETLYHKMGPLLVALKPILKDGIEHVRLRVNVNKNATESFLFPVKSVLKQCGVE